MRSITSAWILIGAAVLSDPEVKVSNYAPKDSDDGGKDEATAFVKEIETRTPINITQVPDIPEQEFRKLKSNAKEQASWICRWYEVHKPEFFGCIAINYVNLVEEDCRHYPGEVLLKIRGAKEAYIKSQIYGIPIKQINPDVFTDTNYYLNGLIPEIRAHRDDLVELINIKIASQLDTVKVSCHLPLTERHGEDLGADKDKHYTMDEDYSPHEYNRL